MLILQSLVTPRWKLGPSLGKSWCRLWKGQSKKCVFFKKRTKCRWKHKFVLYFTNANFELYPFSKIKWFKACLSFKNTIKQIALFGLSFIHKYVFFLHCSFSKIPSLKIVLFQKLAFFGLPFSQKYPFFALIKFKIPLVLCSFPT